MSRVIEKTITIPHALSRRDLLKFAGAAGLTSVAAAALWSSGAMAQDGASGTAVGGLGNAILGLDPHLANQVGGMCVISYVFEGLYRIEPATGDAKAELVDGDIEQVSDLVYRAKIRAGATFHNGSPLTAQDVAFTYARVMSTELGSFAAQFLNFLKSVTATDAQTVELTLNHLPAGLGVLKQRLAMIKIMSEADTTARSANEIALAPMGSGPYVLAENLSGERVLLTRHEGYNGALPNDYDSIDLRLILEPSARVAALRTGQVSAIEEVPYPDLQSLDDAGFETASLQTFTMSLLEFNCGKAPFNDPRVRQAVLFAIDRDLITQAVFLGNGAPALAYFPEDHPYYTRPETVFVRDVEKAKALLAEAGVSNLSFELMVSDQAWILPQGELIQASLAEAGITVTLKPGETESLYAFVSDASFEAYLAFTDPSIFSPDPDLLLRWVFAGTLARALWHWNTAETDKMEAMLEAALQLSDEAELKAAYAEILEYAAQQCPAFPLHHRKQPTAWVTDTPGFVALPRTGLSYIQGA